MDQRNLFETVARQLSIGACIVDEQFTLIFCNDFFVDRLKSQSPPCVGDNLLTLVPEQASFLRRKIQSVFVLKNAAYSYWEQRPHVFDFHSSRPITGEECQMFQNVEIYPIFNDDHNVEYACLLVHDMTVTASYHHELTRLTQTLAAEKEQQRLLIKKLEDAQNQLLQSEKMAAIGQLAAGVAHEINNPIGFIFSNLQSLEDYLDRMQKTIELLNKLVDKTAQNTLMELRTDFFKRHKIDFVLSDSTDLLQESLEGANRVMAIVKSLKEFSHVDSVDWQEANIVDGIESTLRIINNELKYKADVTRDYADHLPMLYCQAMQLNQVFMNLLLNAAQAMTERGEIHIKVYSADNALIVEIKDTGHGIAKEHLDRIFEPFFTTKPVGQGTGLGLSLSYSIITRHKGHIEVESEIGKGTLFRIRLPLLTSDDVHTMTPP
jgi:signal transduction histidine kinase